MMMMASARLGRTQLSTKALRGPPCVMGPSATTHAPHEFRRARRRQARALPPQSAALSPLSKSPWKLWAKFKELKTLKKK